MSTVRGIRRACGEIPGRNRWGNPEMNRSAEGWGRSSLRLVDEGVLIHPPSTKVIAGGTVGKNNV